MEHPPRRRPLVERHPKLVLASSVLTRRATTHRMCAFPRRFSLGPVILASSDAEASTPMLVSLEIVFVCSVPRTGKGRVACRARACCSKYAVAQLALPLDAHGRAEPLGSLCAGRGVVMDARTRPLEQRLSVDITLCHKKMSSHARCPCGLGLKPPRTVRKWVEVGGAQRAPPPTQPPPSSRRARRLGVRQRRQPRRTQLFRRVLSQQQWPKPEARHRPH